MTAIPVLFPDAEAVVIAGLTAKFADRDDDALVSTFYPNPRVARLVKVTRAGGVAVGIIDKARIVLDCYDLGEVAASGLASLVRGLLRLLDGETHAGAMVLGIVEAGGPVALPDPATDLPRYSLVVEITLRGAPL